MTAPAAIPTRPTFAEATRTFGKIGLLSFGGPAGQIALMHRILVDEKRWLGEAIPAEFGTYSREWRKLGAGLIGGCCRTTPNHIRQISDRFRKRQWPIA